MSSDQPKDLNCYRDQVDRGYVFNDDDNTWKSLGFIGNLPLVAADQNGLVYPESFNKLSELMARKDELVNFSLTEQKPYFYTLVSGDGLLKITFDDGLRLEIDRGSLNRRFSSTKVVGIIGPIGATGLPGMDGRPAKNERLFVCNSAGEFVIPVPAPISGQPISIRGINQYREQVFEVLIDPARPVSADVAGNVSGITYVDGVMSGVLSNPKLKIKVRQRGPSGDPGDSGQNAILIKQSTVTTVFKQILANLYKSRVNSNLIFKKIDLSSLPNCVIHVSPSSLPIGEFWAASEVSTTDCKNVLYHRPDVLAPKPDLDLPSWTATSGCADTQRQELSSLDWQAGLDVPFSILTDPLKASCSCKVPFWFCGNAGTLPCDGEINIDIPVDLPQTTSSTTSTSTTSTSSTSTSSTSSTSSSTTTTHPGSSTTTHPGSSTTPPFSTGTSTTSSTTSTPPATTPPSCPCPDCISEWHWMSTPVFAGHIWTPTSVFCSNTCIPSCVPGSTAVTCGDLCDNSPICGVPQSAPSPGCSAG